MWVCTFDVWDSDMKYRVWGVKWNASCRSCYLKQISKETNTNLWNAGWISADRSTKTTLILTIPGSGIKSSTKDLSFPIFEIMFQREPFRGRLDAREGIPQLYDVGQLGCLSLLALHRERWISSLSSMDSDLEAFSHNPTDDSFAALAAQPTALPNIRTNGSSRTKLDYCRDNQLISRVKLTCLTTV